MYFLQQTGLGYEGETGWLIGVCLEGLNEHSWFNKQDRKQYFDPKQAKNTDIHADATAQAKQTLTRSLNQRQRVKQACRQVT